MLRFVTGGRGGNDHLLHNDFKFSKCLKFQKHHFLVISISLKLFAPVFCKKHILFSPQFLPISLFFDSGMLIFSHIYTPSPSGSKKKIISKQGGGGLLLLRNKGGGGHLIVTKCYKGGGGG